MKLGRSSLVVSLPKSWVEVNKVKAGDTMFISAHSDNSLNIRSRALREELPEITLTIELDEKRDAITRKIISCYLNCYASIRLASTKVFTIEQQRAIREIAGKLYLRIMKADAQEVLIESLIDISKIPPDMGIRRMHIITLSMLKDVLKALEQRDTKLASVVYSLDDDVDQFSFLLLRMLRSIALNLAFSDQTGLTLIDCLDYQTVVHRIEQVADNVRNISKTAIALGSEEPLPPFLLEPLLVAGRVASGIFEEGVKSFFTKDVAAANKIIDSQIEIAELNREIIEKTMVEKRAIIVCATCQIRDSISRIAECGADIAKVTINRVIGRE